MASPGVIWTVERCDGFYFHQPSTEVLIFECQEFLSREKFEVCVGWHDDSSVCALGFELATENGHRRIS
jgi:hypothetical protein